MNSFGNRFRVSIFGETHGKAVGIAIDGVPAGVELSETDFEFDLAKRRSGGAGTTTRREPDVPHILSGVYNGVTTGAPLAIVFENRDVHPDAYVDFAAHPRPSHADRVATAKFGGSADLRGGGHFSGRLTVCLVAAGVVAKKIVSPCITFKTQPVRIGSSTQPSDFERTIAEAQVVGDSVGGVIECTVTGVSIGIGEPFFNSIESVAAHLLFSIPGVKGVEFGAGFMAGSRLGSENNDAIIEESGTTATNNDGGINGGLTNGNPLVVRVAVKPTPSIAQLQRSYNFETGRVEPLVICGCHDTCIALRATVVVEAVMAIVLADLRN